MMTDRQNRTAELVFKDTTFWGMLKVSRNELLSWSLLWSALFTAVLLLCLLLHGSLKIYTWSLSVSLTGIFFGASAGLLAIVISALAVTLAVFRDHLLPAMLESKILHKFLFPFWLASVLWVINIVLCILIFVNVSLNSKSLITPTFFVELFFFLYASFYTVSLTGFVIRLSLQRAQIP